MARVRLRKRAKDTPLTYLLGSFILCVVASGGERMHGQLLFRFPSKPRRVDACSPLRGGQCDGATSIRILLIVHSPTYSKSINVLCGIPWVSRKHVSGALIKSKNQPLRDPSSRHSQQLTTKPFLFFVGDASCPGRQEYVVTFDSVRPIFEYNQTWDFKAYKAQQHSVATLKEQMQRIGVWVNELEKMRARQPCGILEVGHARYKSVR